MKKGQGNINVTHQKFKSLTRIWGSFLHDECLHGTSKSFLEESFPQSIRNWPSSGRWVKTQTIGTQ